MILIGKDNIMGKYNATVEAPELIKDLGMLFPSEESKRKRRFGIYKCHCGVEFKCMTDSIKQGNTNSCGCYHKAQVTTHGLEDHHLYQVWNNMRQRIYNPKADSYHLYGERGITLCDRWHDVANFIADMEPTYKEGLTIDRINSDGNYEPDNCRWTTKEVQARNTRLLRATNTSGYRGVCLGAWNRWQSTIALNGKNKHLGAFSTALEAAQAYDKYVIDNNLEHTINFPTTN